MLKPKSKFFGPIALALLLAQQSFAADPRAGLGAEIGKGAACVMEKIGGATKWICESPAGKAVQHFVEENLPQGAKKVEMGSDEAEQILQRANRSGAVNSVSDIVKPNESAVKYGTKLTLASAKPEATKSIEKAAGLAGLKKVVATDNEAGMTFAEKFMNRMQKMFDGAKDWARKNKKPVPEGDVYVTPQHKEGAGITGGIEGKAALDEKGSMALDKDGELALNAKAKGLSAEEQDALLRQEVCAICGQCGVCPPDACKGVKNVKAEILPKTGH